MSKKVSRVDNEHHRVTSEDGKESYLYKTDGFSDYCVEYAEHHSDGTTTAYENPGAFSKGKKKS